MRERTASCLPVLLLVSSSVLVAGCPGGDQGKTQDPVVVYSAADRELAQDVLDAFSKESGVRVDAKWDTEASKTTGLAQAIDAERGRPRADVFWDNEPVQAVLLARRGLLAKLPAEALSRRGSAPADKEGRWVGFAARARVILVNTALVASGTAPVSFRDLANPRFKGRAGVANPLFGSTTAHVCALVAKLGEKETRSWLEALRANDVAVCAGNGDVQKRVASGELMIGLTDTDDAWGARSDGKPVDIVFPDQGEGGLGTVVLPNAVAVVEGAPHPETAAKLALYLASSKAEAMLAHGAGQQIPLLPGGESARPSWIPANLKVLDVSWDAVADAEPTARALVKEALLSEKK
ncbi:extracellular solute-binding protein [bacterium]|nr:extracellular solute-binding protein [bacterium]